MSTYCVEISQFAETNGEMLAHQCLMQRSEVTNLEQAWHRRIKELRKLNTERYTAEIVCVEDGVRF